MDQLQSYKSFLNSYYLSEGIRTTVGIVTPAMVMGYFGLLPAGIVLSIGAMCLSSIDSPGPIHHRVNSMSGGIGVILLVSLITGWAAHLPVLLGVLLVAFFFILSMLGVYGARMGSIGFAGMLIMTLSLSQVRHGWEIIITSLYVAGGGVWYMLFSLMVHGIRPYKLARQALGTYIQSIADYFRVRAGFYEEQAGPYDQQAIFRKLMQAQSEAQERQNLVNDILFKSRSIVKESTHTGRTLLMIYLDVTDLFESIMTSYHDYKILHDYFDKTGILEDFHQLVIQLADELDEIGLAVQSGSSSRRSRSILPQVKMERERFKVFREKYLNPENLEGFIGLRRILDNIEDIARRLYTLHQYTRSSYKIKKKSIKGLDYSQLVLHQKIHPKILLDNLSLKSNIFRHSLRVSISVLAGYLISFAFPLGHSYWIILTILVILKPAYSLTKKRNSDRLIGTFIGLLIGIPILLLVKNNTALMLIMFAFMAGCYIFIRKNYFIGVLLMSPFVLLFTHLLYAQDTTVILADRMLDTFIGSVIAFITSSLLVPSWERETIRSFMLSILKDNCRYFSSVAASYHQQGDVQPDQYTVVARKNALVSLANLSDAFTRMLSEPKSQQNNKEQLHQFVALNHRLISHIATLSFYWQQQLVTYDPVHFKTISAEIIQHINNAINLLEGRNVNTASATSKEGLWLLNSEMNELMEKRKTELSLRQLDTDTRKGLLELKSLADQFNFITNIVIELQKVCNKYATENPMQYTDQK